MQQLRHIDHLADMALEHQAEMLRLSQSIEPGQPLHTRWRVRLAVFIGLALPAAFLLVRAW